jgi:hypothetical protein
MLSWLFYQKNNLEACVGCFSSFVIFFIDREIWMMISVVFALFDDLSQIKEKENSYS